jgi:hypothetical protein
VLSWSGFETAAPELAGEGRRLLDRGGLGQGLLATVRGAEPPRIHPVTVSIVDGRLLTFILASAKRVDLESDGRYALHNLVDPAHPSELSIRGRATPIDDGQIRDGAAGDWAFDVDESYRLFELSIEAVVVGSRASPHDWPPVYAGWRAPGPG